MEQRNQETAITNLLLPGFVKLRTPVISIVWRIPAAAFTRAATNHSSVAIALAKLQTHNPHLKKVFK